MITATRSAGIQPGKLEAAYDWAVRVAMYINEKFGTDYQVLRNVTGNLYKVHWAGTFESLADWEAFGEKINEDDGYQALVAEGRDNKLLILPSLEDHLYQSVP